MILLASRHLGQVKNSRHSISDFWKVDCFNLVVRIFFPLFFSISNLDSFCPNVKHLNGAFEAGVRHGGVDVGGARGRDGGGRRYGVIVFCLYGGNGGWCWC